MLMTINYVERPIAILDRKKKTMHNKVVNLVMVQLQHWRCFECTCELKDEMRKHHLKLFAGTVFEDKVGFKWGGGGGLVTFGT